MAKRIAVTVVGTLGAAAVLVLILHFVGALDPTIELLDKHSAAVAAVASIVTALATAVLATFTASSLSLYQLEREKRETNELRIADECGQLAASLSGRAESWSSVDLDQVTEGGPLPVNEYVIPLTEQVLDEAKEMLTAWKASTQKPKHFSALAHADRRLKLAREAFGIARHTDLSAETRRVSVQSIAENLDGAARNLKKVAYGQDNWG